MIDAETWKRYRRRTCKPPRQHRIKHERTTDIASLLRPPGTYNRKHATPAPVTIMDQPGDIPYQLGQLGKLLDARHSAFNSRPAQVNRHSIAGRIAAISVSGVRYSTKVIEGCAQLRSPYQNALGYVPEPLWHIGLGVFAFIEGDGDDAAHEWSSDDDRYDYDQTQSRLDRIRATTTGATTCARFHQENPETCEACPHWQKIKSPISLASRSGTEHERPQADKPRLLIENCNPDQTVAALRNILADAAVFMTEECRPPAFDQIQRGMVAQAMTPDLLVLMVHEVCRPYALKTKDGTVTEVDARLPRSFAVMYLDWRGEWQLPPLNGIASSPMLYADGSINSREGYDPASGMWCGERAGPNETYSRAANEGRRGGASPNPKDIPDILLR